MWLTTNNFLLLLFLSVVLIMSSGADYLDDMYDYFNRNWFKQVFYHLKFQLSGPWSAFEEPLCKMCKASQQIIIICEYRDFISI